MAFDAVRIFAIRFSCVAIEDGGVGYPPFRHIGRSSSWFDSYGRGLRNILGLPRLCSRMRRLRGPIVADVARVSRESASLRQQVVNHVRDAILDGRLKPGQKLVERELCGLLDISRTLLREVLQQLQAEGLITSVLHRGPSVALICAEEVAELYEVREVLEALAVRSFAEKATDTQIVNLRLQMTLLHETDANNPRDLLIAKSGFYAVILEGCGNRIVGQVLTQLTNRMMLFRRMSLGAPGRIREMLDELEAVVRAIEKREADRAAELCALHVANAAATVLREIEKEIQDAVA